MMYKTQDTNKIDSKYFIQATVGFGLLFILQPVIRELLNVVETAVKILLRIN